MPQATPSTSAAATPKRGQAAAQQLGARLVQLDVTDDDSVSAAAQLVDEMGGLDVLVNNAGIEGRGENNTIIGAEERSLRT